MKKYTIDFDMDHVLADFQKSYDENWNELQIYPQAEARFFDDLDQLYSNNIPNTYFVKKLIEDGHTIRIVTAPSIKNVNCWTGKAVWIRRHFDEELLKSLIITYDKTITSHSADILVDDSTIHGQASYGEGHILYGSKEYSTMDIVYYKINNWSINNKIFK